MPVIFIYSILVIWNQTSSYIHILGKMIWVCQMNIKTNNQVVFYSIQGSTIKKFLLLDFILGTGIYYLVKIISSSILIGSIGSFICTEGIKRLSSKRLR